MSGVCVCVRLSHVQLFATSWTVVCLGSLSVEFSRQEYRGGQPFPSPADPGPGIELRSPALQTDSLPSEPPGKPFLTWGQGQFLYVRKDGILI